ncbi:MAG: DUF4291 domain-containing protein [Bacteroidota bacterium]
MHLGLERYPDQRARWPQAGRHILAQHDDDTVVVYQAYNAEIGHPAARLGAFGGAFSYDRMSWVKPNFLWMMYRSGWGTKPDQEVTLAVRLRRSFFDEVLAAAVPSSFDATRYENQEEWRAALKTSDVRLQWDPDHDPTGAKVERRAIQLGLRGRFLSRYGRDEPLEIVDVSAFVSEQRRNAEPARHNALLTPRETVYLPSEEGLATHLGLDGLPRGTVG